MANKVTMNICGQEYTLVADESAAYMEKVGALVDEKMRQVLDALHVSQTDAAVLAAVNLADELLKNQAAAENLRRQVKNYLDEATQAKNADALVLEVDMCRCAECFLQSISAHQRSAAVVFVHFADLFGDFNPRVGLIQFLAAEFLGKDRIQVFCFQRLLGGGIERRHGLVHHVGLYIIPVMWNFFFR